MLAPTSTLVRAARIALCGIGLSLLASPAHGDALLFSTGDPDGKIATASRPDTPGKAEIESADDFTVAAGLTSVTGATFTGLVPSGAIVTDVIVEIYRVFPDDSQAPPDDRVPTRTNSPSDFAFGSRDSADGSLLFTTTTLSTGFTAANSVLNGINPKPAQETGGEGPVSGDEVRFNVSFTLPFSLPADHYFFVPQVALDGGDFYWLSAPKPIVPPGTPFSPDLQSWIRNASLDPDWLRIGTDIVGPPSPGGAAPTFNAAFTLVGKVPEPATILLLGVGLVLLWWGIKRRP